MKYDGVQTEHNMNRRERGDTNAQRGTNQLTFSHLIYNLQRRRFPLSFYFSTAPLYSGVNKKET